MKSRNNQTGRRLLIVNSVVILLLVNSISLVQSEEPTKSPIELSSWIEVSDKNWPGKDVDGGSGEFLVYHSEYANSTLFGLNKKLSDDINLVAIERPELSFRYWSSSDGSLRSRSSSGPVRRDIKLTKNNWLYTDNEPVSAKTVRTDLKKISKEDWSNFAFISQDVFTLALKDVKVKYLQRVDLDKIETPEITAFNASDNFVNFKESVVVKTPTVTSNPAPSAAAAPTGKEPKVDGTNLVFEAGTSTFKLAQNPKIIVLTVQIEGSSVDEVVLSAGAKDAPPTIDNPKYDSYFKDTKSGDHVFTELDVKVTTGKLIISKIIFGSSELNGEDFSKTIVKNPEVNGKNLIIKPGTFTFKLKKAVAKIVLTVKLNNDEPKVVTITAKAKAAPNVDNFKDNFSSTNSGEKAELTDLKVKLDAGTLTISKIALDTESNAQALLDTLDKSVTVDNKIATFKAGSLSTFPVPQNVKTIALKVKVDAGGEEYVTLTAVTNAAPQVVEGKYSKYFQDTTKSGPQAGFSDLKVKVDTGLLAISRIIFDPTVITAQSLFATLEKAQVVNPPTDNKLPVAKGTYTINVADKQATTITFKWGEASVVLTVGPGDTFKSNDDTNFKAIFGDSTIADGKYTVLKIVASADSSISEFKINNDPVVAVAELKQKLKPFTEPPTPTNPEKAKTYEYQDPKETTKDVIKGLVQLSEKNPADKTKDLCYTITKSAKEPVIDVYLTLSGALVGIKLDTIKAGDATPLKVCLLKYVALQNIGNYMISLVVQGEVPKGFKLSVEKKVEKIQNSSDIVVPFGDVKPGQWYLYNPHFDYSIIPDGLNSEFLICDIVANCYPYEAVSGQNEIRISSKIQAELVNTPFVRFQRSGTGNFVSTTETKFYENSRKQFRNKFDSDNAKLLKNPVDTQETLTKFTVTYELAFDATSNEAQITVPFDLVDLRAQQLVTTISLDKATRDDIATKKIKSPLTLTKVSIKKSVDQDAYELPLQLGGDEKVELRNEFTIGSDEIVSTVLTQIPSGNSVAFALQLDTSVYKNAKVLLKIDILKSARKTVAGKGAQAKFTIDKDFKSVPKSTKVNSKPVVALGAKSNALLATSWIQSSDAAKSVAAVDVTFKIEVVDTKTKLTDASKIEIYRIITDQGNHQPSDKLSGTFKDGAITFNQTDPKVDARGTFRVAYLIHSNEEFALKITVDKFDATGAVGAATTDNCKKETKKLYGDCQYETLACTSPFTDLDGKACHLSYLNRPAEVKCDMSNGCANIFDHRMPVSKKYISNFDSEYVPFQIEPNTKYQHLLYKRPEDIEKGDFCVTFLYTALESTLTVSTEPNEFGVTFPTTPKDNPIQDNLVCASWLSEDVDQVYGLYFAFDKTPLYDVDNHNVDIMNYVERDSKATLDEGIYINNLDDSQFSVQNNEDKNRWTTEKKELSNELRFTIPDTDLEALPAKAQSDKYTSLYISTIRSKWIKVPNKDGKLSIGFTYDDSLASAYFNVKLGVNSPTERVWHGDVSEIKSSEIFVVKNTAFGNYYQLEIAVELNQTEILEQNKNAIPFLDFVLSFKNFTINDPCVSPQNTLETCTAVKQGKCARSYKETAYSHECKCEKNFNGTHCELTNFCANDKISSRPICKKDKKCENDYVYGQVKCECGTDEVWNAFLQNCINVKILNCGANEVLGNDQKCTCADGFVPIEKACVPFNPCDEAHRKAYYTKTRNFISPKACPNSETSCERIGTGTKPTDFTCKCAKGVNDHLIMTADAKCLPEACANCGTKGCEKAKTGNDWKCTDDECKAEGFQLDKDKKCVLNTKSPTLIAKFHCPGEVELKDDQKPGCKCGDQKFDTTTRGCLNECSAEMLKQCTTQGAVKCDWIEADKKAQCACKEGDIPSATNQSDVESWKCIPQCDVLTLPALQDLKCSGSFEHCEPSVELKTVLSGTADAKLIKDVLVKDTKFNGKKEDLRPKICQCDEGFELYGDRGCVPFDKPTHYIKGMEFDLHLIGSETLKSALTRAEASFRQLILDILDKEKILNANNAKCEKKTDTTISCSIDFQSDADDKTISTKLNDACVKVSDTKCVYLQRKGDKSGRRRRAADLTTPAASATELMVHGINQKVETGVIDYCARKDICAKYQFSTCKNKKAEFECLCEEKPFFEVADKVTTGRNNDLQMQICRVKNLCGVDKSGYGCADKDATCHFNVERDEVKNVYTPTSYCTCPGKNLTLAHQELTCKQTCNAECGNSLTCAQDYYTNAVSCHCKEGYSGDKCDKKVESETTSKAYLISTIVVSIIAVIALIGLAVLYFRRR